MYPHYAEGDMVLVSYDGGKTYIQHDRVFSEEAAIRAKEKVEGHRGQEECYKITASRGDANPFLKYQ